MFCIRCGKRASIGNFCDQCFLETKELFDIDNIKIMICPDCGSYYDKGWKPGKDIEEIIQDCVNNNIKTKNKITKTKLSLKHFGNKYRVTIRCTGLIRPCKKSKAEEKSILITIKKHKCDRCVKVRGGYHEAVLQIRGENKDKILNKVKRMLPKEEIVVTSMDELKNGYDIKFIKKNFAKAAAKQLKKGFKVKESYKLIATKKGKRLYRNYYSVR